MSVRVRLVLDPHTREGIEVDLPPAHAVDLESARAATGVPSFVDLSDALTAKAVALLYWARQVEPPIALAFLGGVAVRLVSRTANDAAGPFRRPLHDLDVAVRHRVVGKVLAWLRGIGHEGGSAVTFFELPGDRIFNTLQGGRRYRLHHLVPRGPSSVAITPLDILADEFRFCHTLDLRGEVDAAAGSGGVLSPSVLLLTKLQMIRRVPAADATGLGPRVLGSFSRKEVLVGAEEKDAHDVLALLADLSFDDGGPGFSEERIAAAVGSDWGLWRTVSLNAGMLARLPALERLPPERREQAKANLHRLGQTLERAEPSRGLRRLSAQWWEEVDSPAPTDLEVPFGSLSGAP